MMRVAGCGGPLEWRGCYSGQYDLWAGDSWSHPAKMAPGLAFRILQHLEELSLLQPGQVVLDPLCGIGTSLLAAAIRGYRAVGVELEGKFVSLARENAARIGLKGFGTPIEVIQGDARRLSKLLAKREVTTITSPPYGHPAQGLSEAEYEKKRQLVNEGRLRRGEIQGGVGRSGALGRSQVAPQGYGTTEGQIGALPDVAITSPPFANSTGQNLGERGIGRGKYNRRKWTPSLDVVKTDYVQPDSPGQIGALPDSVTLTSPPYTERHAYADPETRQANDPTAGIRSRIHKALGFSPGQIGQERPESYLDAMRLVYAEIAKVSPVLVVVVKDPTRNGKLRLLGRDTWVLMEQAGYHIVDYHQAILFEEQEQGHLLDGSVKKPRGRLGFFKRLAYRRGSEIASYEHVLFGVLTK